MKNMKSRLGWAALVTATSLLLAACGGGGGGGSTAASPAAEPALFAGPITGLGSVIVNGVRFSAVGAQLTDDDGEAVNHDQLKLGMTVRVNGNLDSSGQQGKASRVELVYGTRGTVTAVDVAGGNMTLLGQRVVANTATAYQGATGLAGVMVGQAVEVYGVLQADGSLLATLIEVKPALTSVRLVGRSTGITTTTFKVGALTVNFAAAKVTGVLGEGKRVKVKAATGPVNNVLTASSVHVSEASSVYGATVTTGALLKLKGVAEAAPVNGLLNVSGTPVNVSKAAIRGGGAILAGQFIEAKGLWDGSALQATEVELEGHREGLIGGRNELYGTISSQTGSATVVVNGVTVDLSRAMFEHGSLSQLTLGSYVEIKGNLVGSTLQATKIEFKSTGAAAGVSYEHYGKVSGFVSPANFTVNGLRINASQARFEHGSATSLANGVYVEVKGSQDAAGVFIATEVEIKTASRS